MVPENDYREFGEIRFIDQYLQTDLRICILAHTTNNSV